MSDSPLLGLPFLAASQAQKHVTVNDALALLDGLLHLSVMSRAIATPPVTPADGDRYLIAATPTAAWTGHAGHVGLNVAGAWRFLVPRSGWRIWVEAESLLLVFNGSVWAAPPAPTTLQNMGLIGINATADATNKLAVSSASVLFNNVGNGIQFKINKNAATDTASLLFQTGFSGRAEIGTTGDDDLHFKVSANGASFNESLIVSGASGKVTVKNTLALDPQAADPASPSNGQVWYNSTSGKFRGQQNGVGIDLAAGGAGVADGDKGDISVTGSGATWTVDSGSVTNAKLAAMPSGTIKGNNAGATANASDLTAAQVKSILAISNSDVSGLGALATISTVNLASQASGTNLENLKGAQALALVRPALLGKKSVVLDFIGGGYAAIDQSGGQDLRSIEAIAGVTISTPATAIYTSRKKILTLAAANTLRYTHAGDGTALGVLAEPAFSYLNGRTQPLTSQLSSSSGVTDNAAPTGYSGNWIGLANSAATRFSYTAFSPVGSTDYWISTLVYVGSGQLPLVGVATNDDFAFTLSEPGGSLKNPDTGLAGVKIEGPFSGGVYRVSGYVTTPVTPSSNFYGIQKNTGVHSNRNVLVGLTNIGAGRYPPSLFDNAIATPNARSFDQIALPLSNFTADQLTLFAEFVAPPIDGTFHSIVNTDTGSTYGGLSLGINSTGSAYIFYYNAATILNVTAISAALVPGQKYRVAAAADKATGQFRAKISGQSLFSIGQAFTAPTIARLTVGWSVSDIIPLNSTISVAGIVDRAWTAAEIASWTDGIGSVPAGGTSNQVLQKIDASDYNTQWVTQAASGNALTSNPLSQFAATTSLQLAGVMSDETGSGSLVFANSPSLTTPNLGTPSSLALTNATGLPVAGVLGLGSLATQSGTFSGSSSGTNTGDQTITLTGQVTGSGTGTFATTIAAAAVTYAKMQNVSATQRVLGRNTAGAGVTEEVTASQLHDWISATQGTILYRDASAWLALAPGTSGQVLKTQGAAANPIWATLVGGGDMLAANNLSDVPNKITARTNLDVEQAELFKALAADDAGGQNVATAQPWFPAAGGVSVEADSTYFIEGRLHTTRAAGTTSHTTSLLFGGTATLTSLAYEALGNTGDVATTVAATKTVANAATATAVKAASVVATEVTDILIKGIVRVNAAGTFIPQFIYSVAPGGAPTVKANSYFRLQKIGAGAVASKGTWA